MKHKDTVPFKFFLTSDGRYVTAWRKAKKSARKTRTQRKDGHRMKFYKAAVDYPGWTHRYTICEACRDGWKWVQNVHYTPTPERELLRCKICGRASDTLAALLESED